MPYFFLALSIVSNVLGQILMKYAADRLNIAGHASGLLMRSILGNPYIYVGAFFYLLGMAAWLVTLSKLELSVAYPFMAITYVLVTFASFLLFKESITVLKIIGMSLIFVGILVLSFSVSKKGSL